MLQQCITTTDLQCHLLSQGDWHPFPSIADRVFWEQLPHDLRAAHIARAEKAIEEPWPLLPATLYLEFARNGNRSNFEKPYFGRRHLLQDLVLGECVEGNGRFLDRIAEGTWLLCEESSWCLPAHINMQRTGVGLPDVTEPILDLFAGETGSLLAWTSYLLDDALDKVSPQIGPRLRLEVNARITGPFLQRDDLWWMGLVHERPVNNWNPWINSNVLTCGLLLEPDADRRLALVQKALKSIDRFLDPYPRDGGCDEGPGYWGRAGASLFDCLEILYSATAGAFDCFAEPLIRDIGRFIYRVHLAGEWFVNFADAPARLVPDGALVFLYGERIKDADMMRFGAWCAQESQLFERGSGSSLGRALPALFALARLRATAATAPLVRDAWLPEIQVVVTRDTAGAVDGLTLAAKGGHNAESHNHNDVGHFVVYADGRPLLIDVGVEEYCQQTFSADRYAIWTMQSCFHNLPTVNSQQQLPGHEFAARDVAYEADEAQVRFRLNLAEAYSPEAGIASWIRTITFRRNRDVTVEDAFRLHTTPRELFLTFMTPSAVTLAAGRVELTPRELPRSQASGDGAIIFDAAVLRAEIDDIALTDPNLRKVWGDRLYRIRLMLVAPVVSGVLVTHITRTNGLSAGSAPRL